MNKTHHTNRQRGSHETARFLWFILLFTAVTLGLSGLFFLFSGEIPAFSLSDALQDDASGGKGLVVILDAGHGGEDGGAVGVNGTKEKDLNLDLTLMLAAQLRASGVTVLLTREDDRLLYDKNSDYAGKKKQLDLAARLNAMQTARNDHPDAEILFVSIHMNSYPSPTVSGFQVWYSGNDPSSQALAEAVQETVSRHLQPQNHRAVKLGGSNIFLLDRATLPAILVECGFLTNADECSRLSSEDYRREIAFSVAMAILGYHSATGEQS